MSDSSRLTEQDLDLLVYVLDVWLQANDNHPAAGKVEDLGAKLANCEGVKLKY